MIRHMKSQTLLKETNCEYGVEKRGFFRKKFWVRVYYSLEGKEQFERELKKFVESQDAELVKIGYI